MQVIINIELFNQCAIFMNNDAFQTPPIVTMQIDTYDIANISWRPHLGIVLATVNSVFILSANAMTSACLVCFITY